MRGTHPALMEGQQHYVMPCSTQPFCRHIGRDLKGIVYEKQSIVQYITSETQKRRAPVQCPFSGAPPSLPWSMAAIGPPSYILLPVLARK